MFHLIWYILIGLIAGVIAKSVMHVHLTLLWTTVLGIIGSIIGGAVTHVFAPPRDARFHPAGLIFSTLVFPVIQTRDQRTEIRPAGRTGASEVGRQHDREGPG